MPRKYEVVYIFDAALEDATITDTLTRVHALLGARDVIIAAKNHEIVRRGGLRWWLKLPLYRFGILKHPPV